MPANVVVVGHQHAAPPRRQTAVCLSPQAWHCAAAARPRRYARDSKREATRCGRANEVSLAQRERSEAHHTAR